MVRLSSAAWSRALYFAVLTLLGNSSAHGIDTRHILVISRLTMTEATDVMMPAAAGLHTFPYATQAGRLQRPLCLVATQVRASAASITSTLTSFPAPRLRSGSQACELAWAAGLHLLGLTLWPHSELWGQMTCFGSWLVRVTLRRADSLLHPFTQCSPPGLHRVCRPANVLAYFSRLPILSLPYLLC